MPIHLTAAQSDDHRRQEAQVAAGLGRQFVKRILGLAALAEGWDGPGSMAPSPGVLEKAGEVAAIMFRSSAELARPLNLTAAPDGTLLFTLFGREGREAELWLREGSLLECVAEDEAGEFGLELKAEQLPRILDWLDGGVRP